MSFIAKYLPNVVTNWSGDYGFVSAIWQTLYMTFASAFMAGILGLFFGVLLVVTDKNGINPHPVFYSILDKLVNVFRSIPFIIMLALLASFTRLIVHTTIGPTAALVPLVASATPFYARQVQNALVQVDPGVIEAAQAMGESNVSIVFNIYLVEGLPELVRASVLTIISLIGLTAMAGAVGAGGLGSLAVNIGFQRFENDVTIVATIFILILVFLIQFVGDRIVKHLTH
ncbi:methionine ABC transporter permease [Xylocopilactobacillus apicola]|uniref:ABC transporter permease n=1 Tax=Xylocopilactobacillus apicola TaxID=2932184 RepID=A0AAU9CX54_9LACO|nr:methionine ABC transporter permease [Xylocopilactobacillus apicola]BDR58567.1 ABC transporter permease [Xylocopilactobacillus apicola]